jgi:hypothetical protein
MIKTNFVVPDFERAKKIWDVIHSFAATWSSPTFNPSLDIINLLNGVVIGGVGVLPPTSMITYCQKNSSAIYD